ncbi:MAG: hypothetical protein DSY35_00505, partial [Desulfurobacterium sp.]
SLIESYVSAHYPELVGEFKKFLKELSPDFSKGVLSPFLLFSLLLLLEDELFSQLKKELRGELTKDYLSGLLSSFLSIYALFVIGGVVVLPFLFDDEFKGEVYFSPKDGDVLKVYIEVETRLGKLGVFIQLLNDSLSVEAVTESKELRKLLLKEEGTLRRELEEEGFRLVLFRVSGDVKYGEEKKREIFKGGKGVTVDFSA